MKMGFYLLFVLFLFVPFLSLNEWGLSMRILFDLDGTLTDSFDGITKSIQYALKELGREIPEAEKLRWCIGPPLQESFLTLLDTNNRSEAEEALALYRSRYGEAGLFENKLYSGILESLEALRELGHDLSVATSKPEVFAVRIIEHFGLREFFSHVDGSQLDGRRTDKSDLIRHILDRDGLTEAIMVGDREHDIIGGTANGLATVGVLWGNGTKEELQAARARVLVEHPREISSAIKLAQG